MKIHLVKEGETLNSLCEKFCISRDNLISNNKNLEKDGSVKVGDKVRIPTGKVKVSQGNNNQDFLTQQGSFNSWAREKEEFDKLESEFAKFTQSDEEAQVANEYDVSSKSQIDYFPDEDLSLEGIYSEGFEGSISSSYPSYTHPVIPPNYAESANVSDCGCSEGTKFNEWDYGNWDEYNSQVQLPVSGHAEFVATQGCGCGEKPPLYPGIPFNPGHFGGYPFGHGTEQGRFVGGAPFMPPSPDQFTGTQGCGCDEKPPLYPGIPFNPGQFGGYPLEQGNQNGFNNMSPYPNYPMDMNQPWNQFEGMKLSEYVTNKLYNNSFDQSYLSGNNDQHIGSYPYNSPHGLPPDEASLSSYNSYGVVNKSLTEASEGEQEVSTSSNTELEPLQEVKESSSREF